jgi:hypothetical protein
MPGKIVLIKDLEDDLRVRYRFGPDEARLGLLQLDKETGDVHEMKPAPCGQPQEAFFPAALKVREHWRGGAFPDRTES